MKERIPLNIQNKTAVDAVLLRPLPFKRPEELVGLWEIKREGRGDNQGAWGASLRDWKSQVNLFEDVAGYWNKTIRLTGISEPENVRAGTVSNGFFNMFGISPVLGRTFSLDDAKNLEIQPVILSYELWQQKFSADPNIIGRQIILDGVGSTIIGILPHGFRDPRGRKIDLWVPLYLKSEGNRRAQRLTVFARLKPNITRPVAQNQLNILARRIEQEFPETNKGWDMRAESLTEMVLGDHKKTFYGLGVIVSTCA